MALEQRLPPGGGMILLALLAFTVMLVLWIVL